MCACVYVWCGWISTYFTVLRPIYSSWDPISPWLGPHSLLLQLLLALLQLIPAHMQPCDPLTQLNILARPLDPLFSKEINHISKEIKLKTQKNPGFSRFSSKKVNIFSKKMNILWKKLTFLFKNLTFYFEKFDISIATYRPMGPGLWPRSTLRPIPRSCYIASFDFKITKLHTSLRSIRSHSSLTQLASFDQINKVLYRSIRSFAMLAHFDLVVTITTTLLLSLLCPLAYGLWPLGQQSWPAQLRCAVAIAGPTARCVATSCKIYHAIVWSWCR